MPELSFEKALEKLENIVEELEDGDFSLDNSLKKFEEGVKLVRQCRDRLGKARKKIETLTEGKEGDFSTKEFES